MNLISLNSIYVGEGMQWDLTFDIIEGLPDVRFKIEQEDNSELYKHAYLSSQSIVSENKVRGYLSLSSIFEPDVNDTTKVDIQNKYIIREIIISYNKGQDIIIFSIDTSIPLDDLVNKENQESAEAQQQVYLGYTQRLGESKKLFIYQPTFLDIPFDQPLSAGSRGAQVYIAEFNPDYSWYGFVEPTLETIENINKMLLPDEDGNYESVLEYDGAVFIVAEETEDDEFRAIKPIQMKLFRTNRAIAWTEDFDLSGNSPLEKEKLISSSTRWSKRGIAYKPLEYNIMNYDDITFPGISQYKTSKTGYLSGVYIDIENQPEKIQNEYTQIVIDNFGAKGSML